MTGEHSNYLFVYGTLMRASRSPFAQLLRVRACYIGDSSAAGRLFHLGAFPGAVFDESCCRRVHGEAFRLSNMKLFNALDAYEGCNAQGTGNFQRFKVRVTLARGGSLTAWTYSFSGPVAGRPLIASGRYIVR